MKVLCKVNLHRWEMKKDWNAKARECIRCQRFQVEKTVGTGWLTLSPGTVAFLTRR
ncbi:hypothetical protein HNP46_006511 [Pseudomonas nitritireducens]|uniref:Uncharacterized protein n=1 Tax=Pseudomonas nitroreducens TaxID=46680 RepID=A0A7W7KRG3_PSENT|nr:hypothetical protein [Pseudomonas nitritireducens]